MYVYGNVTCTLHVGKKRRRRSLIFKHLNKFEFMFNFFHNFFILFCYLFIFFIIPPYIWMNGFQCCSAVRLLFAGFVAVCMKIWMNSQHRNEMIWMKCYIAYMDKMLNLEYISEWNREKVYIFNCKL